MFLYECGDCFKEIKIFLWKSLVKVESSGVHIQIWKRTDWLQNHFIVSFLFFLIHFCSTNSSFFSNYIEVEVCIGDSCWMDGRWEDGDDVGSGRGLRSTRIRLIVRPGIDAKPNILRSIPFFLSAILALRNSSFGFFNNNSSSKKSIESEDQTWKWMLWDGNLFHKQLPTKWMWYFHNLTLFFTFRKNNISQFINTQKPTFKFSSIFNLD